MNEIKLEINVQQLAKTIFDAFSGDGTVARGGIDFIAERGDKSLILVVAAPRTGSTYLSNVLGKSTRLPFARLCAAYSTNEHDLYLPALCIMNRTGCVSHSRNYTQRHQGTRPRLGTDSNRCSYQAQRPYHVP